MDALGVLQRLGSGKLIDDLHFALVDIAEQVAHAKKGSKGTVTLTFEISKDTEDAMVSIIETISRRPPKSEPRGAFFFAMDGGLHREDPRQPSMEFRVLESDQAPEVRDIKEAGE